MVKYYYSRINTKKRILLKLLGALFVSFGIVSFFYFILPLLFPSFYYENVFARSINLPIPHNLIADSALGEYFKDSVFEVSDYENAQNWYPQIRGNASDSNSIPSYTLSIPKLNIKKAIVSTVDYDLSKHLVQYFGTSYPWEKGNAVIFGHSSMSQFYNPKNYKSIFATLHTLKNGDLILINVNNIEYEYRVVSITITEKHDTRIFSQVYDNNYLTLVTCFPPGTIKERLIVRAKQAG